MDLRTHFGVYSIFRTYDGEVNAFAGPGEPTVFVRMAGCNIRCPYCDTGYALERGQAKEFLTPEQAVDRVMNYGLRKVSLTGGDPLWQTQALLERFFRLLTSRSMLVSVETNGTFPLNQARDAASVRYVIDYKLPSSKMEKTMRSQLFLFSDGFTEHDVIKFVVADAADLARAEEIMWMNVNHDVQAWQFAVSPAFGVMSSATVGQWLDALALRRPALANVRLSFQAHKELGWAEQA